ARQHAQRTSVRPTACQSASASARQHARVPCAVRVARQHPMGTRHASHALSVHASRLLRRSVAPNNASRASAGAYSARQRQSSCHAPSDCQLCQQSSVHAGCAQWHASVRERPCPCPSHAQQGPTASCRAQSMPATAPRLQQAQHGTEPEVLQATVVAQFRDYHPEKFSGQGDPRIVDEWVQGLEMIFEVMDCSDRCRVLCAQIQLTDDTRLWWNAYWGMHPGEKEGSTWDRFKELIREKYYPAYYRAEMERQFLALKQGTRTVDEY
ncbi:Unknown protein, partial [Striga hermonthica]